MKRAALFIILSVFATGALITNSQAEDIITISIKKQEEKKKSGWYLTDWLATKEKMRMMDLWLAIHSPSPYEFFIGGDYQFNTRKDLGADTSYSAWRFSGAAYATIFGLEGQYESAGSDHSNWEGNFNLRIFGFHEQGTNITLQAGVRSQDEAGITYRGAQVGGKMTIGITRFFGLLINYKHLLDTAVSGPNGSLTGNRYEGGAFLDFHFWRLMGTYFSEPTSLTTRSGVTMGMRWYF